MKSIIKAKHLIKNYGLKYYFSRLILRLIYKSFSIDHMSLAKEKIRVMRIQFLKILFLMDHLKV